MQQCMEQNGTNRLRAYPEEGKRSGIRNGETETDDMVQYLVLRVFSLVAEEQFIVSCSFSFFIDILIKLLFFLKYYVIIHIKVAKIQRGSWIIYFERCMYGHKYIIRKWYE